MVRMIDLPPTKREAMERYPTPEFETEAWVGGAPLAQRTVTLISSAGLIERGDRPVTPRDARYRVIPHHLPAEQILMSHVSVNFDRTGFQRDLNVVLPRDRLDELVASGRIGGAAPSRADCSTISASVPWNTPICSGATRRGGWCRIDGRREHRSSACTRSPMRLDARERTGPLARTSPTAGSQHSLWSG